VTLITEREAQSYDKVNYV